VAADGAEGVPGDAQDHQGDGQADERVSDGQADRNNRGGGDHRQRDVGVGAGVRAVGDQRGAVEPLAGAGADDRGDPVPAKPSAPAAASAPRFVTSAGSISRCTASSPATQALTTIASTTARPAQRSARALRKANARPSGIAVAASPALWMTSASNATLPDSAKSAICAAAVSPSTSSASATARFRKSSLSSGARTPNTRHIERAVMKDGRRFGGPPKPYQPPEHPEGKIVIAAEVTISSADFGQLEPMITATETELVAAGVIDAPEVILADAGYWHTDQIQRLTGRGRTVLVPPDAGKRKGARPGWDGGLYAFMRRALSTHRGGELYAKPNGMIEPVFANTKFNRRIDRLQRRGRAAASSEWRLTLATHNLLKLHTHTLAANGA